MPDSVILERRPALPGFLARKQCSKGDITGLRVVIEACRAELDWSRADSHRMATASSGLYVLNDASAGTVQAYNLPHELAAAMVLNTWGHLHPLIERMRAIKGTIRARRSAGWDVSEHVKDFAWYAGERRRIGRIFRQQIGAYRKLRRRIDLKGVA